MEKQPNFHQVSEERKVLRKTRLLAPETMKSVIQEEIEKKNSEAGKFRISRKTKIIDGEEKEISDFSGAKKRLKTERFESESRFGIDEQSVVSELGESYNKIANLWNKKEEQETFLSGLVFKKINSRYAEPLSSIIERARAELENIKLELAELEKSQYSIYKAVELLEYKKGLSKPGHIAPVSSVQEQIRQIEIRMLNGKPIFLHGPTGTGKTSLAKYSAKNLTGKDAEVVYCNPQTRESNIWGKTGIRPAEGEMGRRGAIQTVDIFGPLAKAMQEGKTVVFDEFTALPQEQMVFVKGILNSKIGDVVNVVGNGQVRINPGFMMIFTANLKSDKNPERQALPPEIAREFEQNNLEIQYTPKAESYDIMLARLMNLDGSIDLSYYDLNTTLKNLCEAISEIQIAYTNVATDDIARQTGTMDASGKKIGLKKLVFTQGTIENILDAWRTEKVIGNNVTFAEFVNNRLKTAITFKEYPESDRLLAAKILASKGFLTTQSETELGLPNGALGFASASRSPEKQNELKTESAKVEHLSIKEVAELDPFGLRKVRAKTKAEGLLPKSSKKESQTPATPEILSLNIEKSLEAHRKFYESHSINLPPDFEERVRQIWQNNFMNIENCIRNEHYDRILIIPDTLPDIDTLHSKMTKGYKPTYKSGDFIDYGSFVGAKNSDDGLRLILVHNIQELDNTPILNSTLNMSPDEFNNQGLEGLSLPQYLVFQRMFFEETNKHLDTKLWTWLPKTLSGPRVVGSLWNPVRGWLNVSAYASGSRGANGGFRLSRSFG